MAAPFFHRVVGPADYIDFDSEAVILRPPDFWSEIHGLPGPSDVGTFGLEETTPGSAAPGLFISNIASGAITPLELLWPPGAAKLYGTTTDGDKMNLLGTPLDWIGRRYPQAAQAEVFNLARRVAVDTPYRVISARPVWHEVLATREGFFGFSADGVAGSSRIRVPLTERLWLLLPPGVEAWAQMTTATAPLTIATVGLPWLDARPPTGGFVAQARSVILDAGSAVELFAGATTWVDLSACVNSFTNLSADTAWLGFSQGDVTGDQGFRLSVGSVANNRTGVSRIRVPPGTHLWAAADSGNSASITVGLVATSCPRRMR